MSVLDTRSLNAATAAGVVTEFFDRYRAHDVEGMIDLCAVNADFSYVPLEIWGKQRVIRGDGKVATIGKPIWSGLIASFPDLTNVVHSVVANDDGVARAERSDDARDVGGKSEGVVAARWLVTGPVSAQVGSHRVVTRIGQRDQLVAPRPPELRKTV